MPLALSQAQVSLAPRRRSRTRDRVWSVLAKVPRPISLRDAATANRLLQRPTRILYACGEIVHIVLVVVGRMVQDEKTSGAGDEGQEPLDKV